MGIGSGRIVMLLISANSLNLNADSVWYFFLIEKRRKGATSSFSSEFKPDKEPEEIPEARKHKNPDPSSNYKYKEHIEVFCLNRAEP